MRSFLQAAHTVIAAQIADTKGRASLSIAGIALGVALGVTVNLINHVSVTEFARSVRSLAGDADLSVQSPEGFSEQLYARIARMPEVEIASPAVEVDISLGADTQTLKIIGIDPFRAARLQPALSPPAGGFIDLLDPGSIVLSRHAAAGLGLRPGDVLTVAVGLRRLQLKIVALLPDTASRRWLGVMDIAGAQWYLRRIGILDRIDLRLRAGVDLRQFQRRLQTRLPAGVHVITPVAQGERVTGMSYAYRI
ncbi:MAG: ABC transporter permease, partial [Burkholderiales bacterium]